jgi:hypothetical protein
MPINLSAPHIFHVLAAYGAAVVLLGGLVLVTACDYFRAHKK